MVKDTDKIMPKFLRVHCNNTDPVCEKCPREFSISVGSISTIAKNGGGRAIIQTAEHLVFPPLCGEYSRSIQTEIKYKDLLKLLNGSVEDVGKVKLVYYKDVI